MTTLFPTCVFVPLSWDLRTLLLLCPPFPHLRVIFLKRCGLTFRVDFFCNVDTIYFVPRLKVIVYVYCFPFCRVPADSCYTVCELRPLFEIDRSCLTFHVDLFCNVDTSYFVPRLKLIFYVYCFPFCRVPADSCYTDCELRTLFEIDRLP